MPKFKTPSIFLTPKPLFKTKLLLSKATDPLGVKSNKNFGFSKSLTLPIKLKSISALPDDAEIFLVYFLFDPVEYLH